MTHAVVVRAHVDEGLLDVHAHAEMPWWLHAVTPAATSTTATTGTAAVMVVRVSGSARRRMPS